MPQLPEKSIDELVREVRSQAYPDSKDGTKHPCKTMRMLRVNHPVPVYDIYVKLNVLDGKKHWGSGTGNQPLESALSMVQNYSRLMVLGKPGSGKTTFLKSLLVECVEGRLRWNQQDYVPIFITLKDFAKASQKQLQSNLSNYVQSNLSNYIYQEFCSWCLRDSLKDRQVIEKILTEGRALILLDGLDEVPEEIDEKSQELDQESVINEILNFSRSKNRIVITCRTPGQQSLWEGFTDVEIADFEKEEEREEFVKKWFAVVNRNAEPDKLAKQLIRQLREPENQPIVKLAVTPILLNLICIKFRDGDGELPKNRADLYEDGVTILLKEWDATKPAKGVKRKTVLNSLKEIDDKKRLLAKVAAILFEQNDYSPKQEKLKKLISKELDVSPSKAEEVIKYFEEQSGLMVEHSKGVWSFSHLTFQEYFTAKWFCDDLNFQSLVTQTHITDNKWREVFLLSVNLTSHTDELLLLMREKVDEFVMNEKLQLFLKWIDKKANKVQQESKIKVKLAGIRAYYLHIPYSDSGIDLYLARSLEPKLNQHPSLKLDLALRRTLDSFDGFINDSSDPISTIEWLTMALEVLSNDNLNLQESLHEKLLRELKNIMEELPPELKQVSEYRRKSAMQRMQQHSKQLQKLEKHTPNPDISRTRLLKWWLSKGQGQDWVYKLRGVMINYRGHEFWQFSEQQKKALYQYHHANRLLVDCLNSSCAVSDHVKDDIEKTLFLPIDENKKCQQQM